MKTNLPASILIALIFLAITTTAQPTFVKELPAASSHFTKAGEYVYFIVENSLFRTDGTSEGTVLVYDELQFEASPRLLEYNELLIFIAISWSSGESPDRELWRSDGTPSGTFLLHTSVDSDLNIFGIAGDYLYFSAGTPETGTELFKTNGTKAGTTLVKDIRAGGESAYPLPLAAVGTQFYFIANDGIHGQELWRTDGTTSGTTMVRDINPGGDNGVRSSSTAVFNNRLFFSGVTNDTGAEAWVTDGTSAGTVLLKDLIPGDSAAEAIDFGINHDGWLYFFTSTTVKDEPDYQDEPDHAVAELTFWRSDGTTEGTTAIKDFTTACAHCRSADYHIYNDALYFFLQESPDRDVLYTTDGTPGGTTPVFSLASNGNFLGELNGGLIFLDVGNVEHTAIHRTDGTLAGTEKVHTIISALYRNPGIVTVGDKIFFPDHDAPYDPVGDYSDEDQYQLMVSDGVTSRSIRSMGGSSFSGSANLVDFNGRLIFTTQEVYPNQSGNYSKKLWLHDPSQPFEPIGTFTLINADTDEDIQELKGGEIVSKRENTSFNIRYTPPGAVKSVVFRHQNKIVRTENEAPFSLAGDRSGDYLAWTAGTPGEHIVSATPYTESGGKGIAGRTHVINFTIADEQTGGCAATGTILREHWAKVQGAKVSDIPLSLPPTSTQVLTVFESPQNIGTNYGTRIRGYICPPATGDFVFWIASNDHSELWLSTDHDAQNRRRIAYVTGATNFRQWDKFRTQRSVPITLEYGRSYYIEALHKQGVGSDHLSVGWQLPDGSMERPIAGGWLSPFGEAGDTFSHLTFPADGATNIDPSVIKLETEFVPGALRYSIEISDRMDFSGQSKMLMSAEDRQNKFIIKDLSSATTYYVRVKTDNSGFGPVTSFRTRNPISRLRLWGIASYGGYTNTGTIFSYSIDDNSFVKHYDQPLFWYDNEYVYEERLRGSLIAGPDGSFYGHREENYGAGVFEMDSQGNVAWWSESSYFNESHLLLASNNHIYSTATDNWVPGIIDKHDVESQTLLLDARMYVFTQFCEPNTPLIELGDGYLCGAAGRGGVNDGGFIYKVKLDGTGFKIIHYFHDASSGMKPRAGLLEHNEVLYGTTTTGGAHGHGTIFRIKPDGESFLALHHFDGENGSTSRAELVVVNDILYGTTDLGGASDRGTVFRISTDGTGYSVLHSFNGTDGWDPARGLVNDRNGNLYGMTTSGGANNMGVIYKVSSTGGGYTKLFDFNSESGGRPEGKLVIREDTYEAHNTASAAREKSEGINISIHPNPSTDHFRMDVDASNDEPLRVIVTDQYGAIVQMYDATDAKVIEFGGDLKRGLYLVKVLHGKGVWIQRVVKK